MPDVLRVAVIGGGIIGLAVAYELSRRGASVQLFEASDVDGAATPASAGILAPYIEAHTDSPLLPLTVRSLEIYEEFVARVTQDSGRPVELRRCGTLEVALAAEDALALQSERSAGIFEWHDASSLRAVEPSLARRALGARLCARHGYVKVGDFARALREAAALQGMTFSGGRVAGCRTSSTGLQVLQPTAATSVDAIVLAAGAWSPSVSFDDRAADAVYPVRGQLVRLHAPSLRVRHVLWSRSCYIVPWTDGTQLVGATAEEVGFDVRSTASGVRELLTAAGEVLPAIDDATFLGVSVGLRPATRDGLPIIGPSPQHPRFVYATGHFRNGVLLAPLTAAAIADYLVDDRHDPMLSVVAPQRFQNGGSYAPKR